MTELKAMMVSYMGEQRKLDLSEAKNSGLIEAEINNIKRLLYGAVGLGGAGVGGHAVNILTNGGL